MGIENLEAAEFLTVQQAAERMGMSTRYVRRLVAERRIPFHRMGRAVRIGSLDVQEHIAAGRVDRMDESAVWRELRGVV